MRQWILILSLLAVPIAKADLLISFIDESRLPYSLSPSNYSNSPSNYGNSESNYSNSPSKYGNGSNGKNRLLLKEGSKVNRVGYYVHADNGVINFFTSSGKRLFYNSGKGSGVFHGKKGFFCGVIARVENENRLVLTEAGQKALLVAQ